MTTTCAEFERVLAAIRSQSAIPTLAERAAALEHYDGCPSGRHSPDDFGRGIERDLTPEEVSEGRHWCAFLEACGVLRIANRDPRRVGSDRAAEPGTAHDSAEGRREKWRDLLELDAPVGASRTGKTSDLRFRWTEVGRCFHLPLALPEHLGPMLGGQVFDVAAPVEGRTLNGRVRWRIVEEGPEVIVNIETEFEDFLGRAGIRLRWGGAAEDVVFARCAGRIVSVVVVSKAQLGESSGRDVPVLEVRLSDSEPAG